jgi:hypothetical protein
MATELIWIKLRLDQAPVGGRPSFMSALGGGLNRQKPTFSPALP